MNAQFPDEEMKDETSRNPNFEDWEKIDSVEGTLKVQ
jgi:hypothetical protein